jgi:hypothetical protein
VPEHPDDTPPSWDEHADGLRGQLRALALLHSLVTDDDPATDALADELNTITDEEHGAVLQAMGGLALMFGEAAYGENLADVLRGMQADIADHMARYDPGGSGG